MRFLVATTEDFIKQEETALAADASAGSSVQITVQSTQGYAANDYIAVGYEGNELAELVQIATVDDDTTITVDALKFNHSKHEPITKFRFNQRKFYGATSRDGTYNHLSSYGSPTTIEVDDPQGTLLEYTGSEGYTWFKATYYNSGLDDETSIADAEPVEAADSARYASLYDVRKTAGLAGNPFYTDGRIEAKRKQAENEIDSIIYGRYSLPLSEVPDLISYLAEILAAGYILYEEYPEMESGKKLLGEARAILKQIQKGNRVLLKHDGTELATTDVGNVAGTPNAATDRDPIVTMDKEF